MSDPYLSVREYLETYQFPHSRHAPIKTRTAHLAKVLAASAGIEPGEQTGRPLKPRGKTVINSLYRVATYPKAILDQAFREARG